MKEFELIRKIQRETSLSSAETVPSGIKLGIGDDAAVLEVPAGQHLVAATDTLNAGTHFPIDTSPGDIAYKCLAVNLSDMAAMGAAPRWALLSLSLPKADTEWIDGFIAGFSSLAHEYGVSLVGGDTTSGPLSVSLTALGLIKPGTQLMRSGASPGELIVVSGTVGGAARVLELISAGGDVAEQDLLHRPQPRVKLGQALVGFASACIDISHGLLAGLGHVLKASGCAARIELGKLPGSGVLAGLEDEQQWKYQLSGGDDYELLFTLPRRYQGMLATWSRELDINLSVIGETDETSGIRCIRPNGMDFDAQYAGFEHFGQ